MGNSFYTLVCLLFTYTTSVSQTNTYELIQSLELVTSDTQKVSVLLDLGNNYYTQGKPDSALYFLTEALHYAEKSGEPYWKIKANQLTGFIKHNLGVPESGLFHQHKALKLLNQYPKYNHLQANIYNNLALGYSRISKIDSAFYFYSKAESIYAKKKDHLGRWKVLIGMARLFADNQDFQKAIPFAEEALALITETDRMNYGFTLYILNFCYLYSGQIEKYSDTCQKWIRFQSKGESRVLDDVAHNNLISFFGNDLNGTIKGIEKVIAYEKSKNNVMMIGLHYHSLGETLTTAKKMDQAIDAYVNAIPFLKEAGLKSYLSDAYLKPYRLLQQQNKSEEAILFLEQHMALKDTISNDKMNKNLSELEVKYETEKKDQTIIQQTRERNLLLISFLLFGLLGLSVIMFLRNRLISNKQIAAKEAELQSQKITQLEQEKKLLTYNAMINGQEQERQRIAKDLHDGIGGLLSTVKAHFNAIQVEVTKLEKLNVYQKTNALIDEACEEVRRISHDMMPRTLELSGLKLAVEDLVNSLKGKGLNCQLEIIGLEKPLNKHKETMTYRILQELCNNILKHADAQNVLLQIIQNDQQLKILVEDDGCGFTPDEISNKKGIGINSIRSRVKFLEGNINFDSVQGEGTTVNIEIPI